MKKRSPFQSILWDMVLKSTPALILAPVVRAAEQQVHAAVRPRYLNKSQKRQHPLVLPFLMAAEFTDSEIQGSALAAGLKGSQRPG
jgi:hypothetical protein